MARSSSSSSSGRSEFSIDHRTKRPDPDCEECGGHGTYQRQVTEMVTRTCSACNGRGQVEARYTNTGRMETCHGCSGRGTRQHPRTYIKTFSCGCRR